MSIDVVVVDVVYVFSFFRSVMRYEIDVDLP